MSWGYFSSNLPNRPKPSEARERGEPRRIVLTRAGPFIPRDHALADLFDKREAFPPLAPAVAMDSKTRPKPSDSEGTFGRRDPPTALRDLFSNPSWGRSRGRI